MKVFFWILPFLSLIFASYSRSPRSAPHTYIPDIARSHFVPDDTSAFNHPETTHRLIVYVQTFKTPEGNPLSLLPLLEHQTKVTHVILASVHLHPEPGVIKLNDDDFDSETYRQIWEEVKVLQRGGIKVLVLLGGAAKGTYGHLNGTEKEFYKYYNPLLTLLRRYSLDGIDIDIEEPTSLSTPIRLLNAFYRDLGPSFIQTLTPLASAISDPEGQNVSGFSYFELDELATVPGSERKLVHWYNGMFYGGFARGPPFYKSVVERGWEPGRVVMTVLDCAGDGQPNGFVMLPALAKTIQDLREMYPTFGGVAGWEYWDAGRTDREDMEPWEWVKEVGKAVFEPLTKKVGDGEL